MRGGMVLTPPFQHVVDLSFDWRHVGPKFISAKGAQSLKEGMGSKGLPPLRPLE